MLEFFAIAHNATAPTRKAITNAATGIKPSHIPILCTAKDFWITRTVLQVAFQYHRPVLPIHPDAFIV
jgi:hypothetical protein